MINLLSNKIIKIYKNNLNILNNIKTQEKKLIMKYKKYKKETMNLRIIKVIILSLLNYQTGLKIIKFIL